jgi:iron complex outermembrane receptor protein
MAFMGAFLCFHSAAQTSAVPSTPPAAAVPEGRAPDVIVTGNPLRSTQTAVPATTLSGTGLLLRGKSTLGETLDGLPGVASSYFGPNASRPSIRGLDGDRVRILDNGAPALDASGLSYDHAVPADTLVTERVEVLRGPAALLYGGSAAGGVVNLIDNRIAAEPLFLGQESGITGWADASGSSGDSGSAGAVMLEGGTARFSLHADAFRRRSGDVAVPADLTCTRAGGSTTQRRICNSANEAEGGGLGASLHFQKGYLGLSGSDYHSHYGTVAEDTVTIRMRSSRQSLQGEWRDLGSVEALRVHATQSQYTHTEFEAGVAGTMFRNDGNGLRIEARHSPVDLGKGPSGVCILRGVVGVSREAADFSAVGSEAFAPASRSLNQALFAHEELVTSFGSISLGVRWEQADVESFGNPLVARFTPAARRFQPASQALGLVWNLNPFWRFTANLANSERAPKDYELFADGPHLATNAYEVGLPSAQTERSTQIDIGLQWQRGKGRFGVSAFFNQFNNYLLLEATGSTRDTAGNGAAGVGVTDSGNGDNTSAESGGTAQIMQEFAYRQVPARFTGLELTGGTRLREGVSTLDLEWRADLVRATNTATGQSLPRIAPLRAGVSLLWARGPWDVRAEVHHVAAQQDVPAGQTATAGYTLLNASLGHRMRLYRADALWYLRGDNLTDQIAYSATSILTQTAPGKAPLPGRSLKFGVRLVF